MKSYLAVFFAFLTVAILATGCAESPYINGPGDNAYNSDSLIVVSADTSGISISIDSALAIISRLTPGTTTAERYKLSGELTANKTSPSDVPGQYTNINFTLKDATGSITCQYTNNLNNRSFRRSADVPRVGSKLTVVGPLSLYQSSSGATTPQMLNGFIARYDSLVAPPPFPGCPAPADGQISVSQACEIALQLQNKEISTETYKIIAVVTDITELSTDYGNATFNVSDGKRTLVCFRAKGLNNSKFTSADQLLYGDTIVLSGKLQNYNSTPELTSGGYILSSTNPNLH